MEYTYRISQKSSLIGNTLVFVAWGDIIERHTVHKKTEIVLLPASGLRQTISPNLKRPRFFV